jgi:FkbM family methyltransferase
MSETVTYTFEGREVAFDTSTVPESVVESTFTHDRFAVERTGLGFVLAELRPDDVFFDIGAMYGLYTGFVGQELTDGSVIAFEPYPPNCEALERTVELNDLSNVDIYELALDDSAGETTTESPSLAYHAEKLARLQEKWARGQTGTPEELLDSEELAESPFETFSAESRSGDQLVQSGEVQPPDIVKIDVEGGEYAIVDGMTDTLGRADCRCLVCEIHPPDDDTPGERPQRSPDADDSSVDDLIETIESLGFETELDRGDEYLHLRGRK